MIKLISTLVSALLIAIVVFIASRKNKTVTIASFIIVFAVGIGASLVAIVPANNVGIVYSEFVFEFLHISIVELNVVIQGYAQDDQSLLAVFLLEFNQCRDRLEARGAPGRPKVEEEGTAVEIAQPHRIPIRIMQHKIAGRIANLDGAAGHGVAYPSVKIGDLLQNRAITLILSPQIIAKHDKGKS